jgi:Kef-type K+ transport system membrane component KefB
MLVGHPVFWILTAAVLAPLLSEIPIAFKVPVVVLEVVLGIVIGPQILSTWSNLTGSWLRCFRLA